MPRDQQNRREFGLRVASLLAAPAFLAGCSTEEKSPIAAANPSFSGKTLRVLVVGDEALAKAILKLQAEWKAETGSELTVSESTAEALISAKTAPQADAIVYPATNFGDFAEANWLAALTPRKFESPDFSWSQVFEAVTQRETRWGSQNLAASLGAPPLICFYREDLLKELDRSPPETWEQYHRLAEIMADRSNFAADSIKSETWSGAIEPAATGWAVNSFLARAAVYAKHTSHFAALFRRGNMDADIANPAFERALVELIADRKFAKHDTATMDATSVRDAFWRGECGMAITVGEPRLASGAAKPPPRADDVDLAAGFAPLPGARDVFEPESHAWSHRPEDAADEVTYLGFSGRMISVTSNGDYNLAHEFVRRVIATEWNERVPTVTPEGSIVAPIQMLRPENWLGKPATGAEASRFTKAVRTSLSVVEVLHAPRIPGHAEYMQVLDEAVRDALAGKAAPKAALQSAADRWNAITDRIGRKSQSLAYQRSIGLDP